VVIVYRKDVIRRPIFDSANEQLIFDIRIMVKPRYYNRRMHLTGYAQFLRSIIFNVTVVQILLQYFSSILNKPNCRNIESYGTEGITALISLEIVISVAA
jgi:hypothetical protein